MGSQDSFDIGTINKEEILKNFSEQLSEILEKMDISADRLSTMADIDREKLLEVTRGSRLLKWNEYLAILFILWRDDSGKKLVEERTLFPEELKKAMTINRKAHNE